MEFIKGHMIAAFENEGVVSRQLLNPDNSASERVTITEVHLEKGYQQPRHKHDAAEQIWYALKGRGLLLLENNTEQEFIAGDVARFADGDIHGLFNNSDDEFVYLSVTSPPINFKYAYKK